MIEPVFRRDPRETTWIENAACLEEDPELFFPVGYSQPAVDQALRAKAVCTPCPVRGECLHWALDTCQDAGVWGGLDEEERRVIRRQRRLMVASGEALAKEPLAEETLAKETLVGVAG